MNNYYDCIVIGAGMAGCSAAINMARAGYSVGIFEKEAVGGAIRNAGDVTNYIGAVGMNGDGIGQMLEAELKEFDNIELHYEEVLKAFKVNSIDHPFVIKTEEESLYRSKICINAIGLKRRELKAAHIEEAKALGKISYCALCDGPFYYGAERVMVVGSGDTAVHDAVYLSSIAKDVILLKRHDTWKCDKASLNLLQSIPNINVRIGEIESILTIDKEEKKYLCAILADERTYVVDGIFVAIGSDVDDSIIDPSMTSKTTDGVTTYWGHNGYGYYSAGDFLVYGTDKPCQLQTAAYTGMMAALKAQYYLAKNK